MNKIWMVVILVVMGAQAEKVAAVKTTDLDEHNVTYYRGMLKELKKCKTNCDDFNMGLQKTLLQRLINMDASEKKKTETKEKNPADLLKKKKNHNRFFPGLIQTLERKTNLQKDIQRYDERLKLLKDELPLRKDSNETVTLKLQYAFYRKNRELAHKRFQQIEGVLKDLPSQLTAYLKKAQVDRNSTAEKIKGYAQKVLAAEKEIEMAKIEKERLGIAGASKKRIAALEKKTHSLHTQRSDWLKKEMQGEFALFVDALKHEQEDVFSITKRIDILMEKIPLNEHVRDELGKILLDAARSKLGATATLQGAAKEEVYQTLLLFWKKMNQPLFVIADSPVSVSRLLLVILIFLLGITIGFFYKRTIRNLDQHNIVLAASTRMLLSNMGFYTIIIVVLLIVLEILGIDLSSIAIVAGALSVGIGFGLQNVVSNFVSGIILLFERSIKIGDFIQLDHELKGHIIDMRMRSVIINTHENIDVIVPNQDFVRNRVINWTMNDQVRGFMIPFSVAYGTDVHEVVRVVTEAVENCGFETLYLSEDRHIKVIMTELGKSSIDFVLFLWIQGLAIETPLGTLSPYRMLIYDTLTEAGIRIPFPQQDVHIRSVEGNIPLQMADLNPKG